MSPSVYHIAFQIDKVYFKKSKQCLSFVILIWLTIVPNSIGLLQLWLQSYQDKYIPTFVKSEPMSNLMSKMWNDTFSHHPFNTLLLSLFFYVLSTNGGMAANVPTFMEFAL